jgi:hypothetical protein
MFTTHNTNRLEPRSERQELLRLIRRIQTLNAGSAG